MKLGRAPYHGVEALCYRKRASGPDVAEWNLGSYNCDYPRPQAMLNYEIPTGKVIIKRDGEKVSLAVDRLIFIIIIIYY